MTRHAILIALTIAMAIPSTEARDSKVRAEFQRLNPCPANNERRGPCPGYIADHTIALCASGPDVVANMQWITLLEAQKKDADDRRFCAARRREAARATQSLSPGLPVQSP